METSTYKSYTQLLKLDADNIFSILGKDYMFQYLYVTGLYIGTAKKI
jgi:hypothetical protein